MENERIKMKENVIVNKSFDFAVRIIKLYQYLNTTQKEFALAKQLLRCGTSIGANIHEAQDAQSKKDFISKLSISLKEAKETKYWIELLKETNYLTQKQAKSILDDLIELIKLLTSIIKSTKVKNKLKMENEK